VPELDLGTLDDEDEDEEEPEDDDSLPPIDDEDEDDDDDDDDEEEDGLEGLEEDGDEDDEGFDSDDIDNLTGSDADEDDAAEYDWDSAEEDARADELAKLPADAYSVDKTLNAMIKRASVKPTEDEAQLNVLGIDPIRAARSAQFHPFLNSKPHPTNPDGSAKGEWKISAITGQPKRVYPEIEAGYDSDSSTEDQPNRIGNVPLEWYDDMPHIGYDINGRKVAKPATKDELDRFLSTVEDPTAWTSATDKSTGEEVQLTESELDIIKRLEMGGIPDANYDPYEDQIEWFTGKGMEEVMPMSGRPEPKRRFVPSKHEHKRIMKIVRAIREGRITPGAPRPSAADKLKNFYNLWSSDDQPRADHPMHMPAPKLPLPGHAESYNPPAEYLFTEAEKQAWLNAEPEDRKTSYLPAKHDALRRVPGYHDFVQERFERCLDLYLAPRVRRKRMEIEHPDDLLPQLPSPRELKPFPIMVSIVYDHPATAGRVRAISPDPSGSWLLTGAEDGRVRMWDIGLGRCVATWDLFPGARGVGESKERAPVYGLDWCPTKGVAVFAATTTGKITVIAPPQCILSTSSTGADRATHTTSFRHATAGHQAAADATTAAAKTGGANGGPTPAPPTRWTRPSDTERNQGICAHILLSSASSATGPTPKQVVWHAKGDYFATVSPESGSSSSVLVHQLSKHRSQAPFRRAASKGASVQRVVFHPLKPYLFVATQRHVRLYDLGAQTLLKTLQPGLRWISDVSVHPGGGHVLVASYDRKVAWFDLELGVQPYKVLRYHARAVRGVAFHPRAARTFPLFASVGDDGQAQVFHAKVSTDEFAVGAAPLIVPLKVLRGHEVRNGLGVLDVKWHPNQPWLFTAGADGTARLWTT